MKKEKKRPLYEIILHDIKARILSQKWPPGHMLPHEVDLSKAYGCSRMTVSKALNHLAQAGLIVRRRRAGSWVAHPRAQSAALAIPEIEHEVKSMNMAYGYVLLNRTRRKARKSDAHGFAVSSRLPVLELDCLHLAGGRPFCLENRLISLIEAPEAAVETFESTAPGPWLLQQIPWSNARHKIRAAAADARTAVLLQLTEGAPCLVVERETTLGGRCVTAVQLTYPGESHELVAFFTPTDGKTT